MKCIDLKILQWRSAIKTEDLDGMLADCRPRPVVTLRQCAPTVVARAGFRDPPPAREIAPAHDQIDIMAKLGQELIVAEHGILDALSLHPGEQLYRRRLLSIARRSRHRLSPPNEPTAAFVKT